MELLTLLGYIALMALGFGLLIFVHELGHFLAAKWANIRTEGFAIGMGPVVCAYRSGIGFTFGPTERSVIAKAGKPPRELSDEELTKHGIGETEYSLRWLPIGGFVKMLGQDDINPHATSNHPRSYNVAPIGKRMIVVSAGVIMNMILAAVLFIIAFMIGVDFEAPVIGSVAPGTPAATAKPINAEELEQRGIDSTGLQPGDTVTHIDGNAATTFADLQLASAMGREDQAINVVVQRQGVDAPLRFAITPEHNPAIGLLSIGVTPAASTTLSTKLDQTPFSDLYQQTVLPEAGVRGGMRLVSANDQQVTTYQEFDRIVEASGGEPVQTVWVDVADDGTASGQEITVDMPVRPTWQQLIYPQRIDGALTYEPGLFGLTPLTRIAAVMEDSPNAEVLHPGDIVISIGSIDGPRGSEFRSEIQKNAGNTLTITVLRDGKRVDEELTVNRRGMIGVLLKPAWDVAITARPFNETGSIPDVAGGPVPTAPTPIADLNIPRLTRIVAVDQITIDNWPDLRAALRAATAPAHESQTDAEVSLTIEYPEGDQPQDEVILTLSAADIATLHELGWESGLSQMLFEPLMTTRSAGGNPIVAVQMGIEETWKTMLHVYLTVDRLVRGTVGIEQLRGPVGIVHLGVQILDRGFMYLLFLLALISVNLAVINFLPLPIVDGGLFLYLLYEKIKGQPPSIAFQNIATLAGLALIAVAFLVITWNDVARLLG